MLVSLFLTGCSQSPPPPPKPDKKDSPEAKLAKPWFEEVAAKANVGFHHTSGHTTRFYMPEVETGGVGLLD